MNEDHIYYVKETWSVHNNRWALIASFDMTAGDIAFIVTCTAANEPEMYGKTEVFTEFSKAFLAFNSHLKND